MNRFSISACLRDIIRKRVCWTDAGVLPIGISSDQLRDFRHLHGLEQNLMSSKEQ